MQSTEVDDDGVSDRDEKCVVTAAVLLFSDSSCETHRSKIYFPLVVYCRYQPGLLRDRSSFPRVTVEKSESRKWSKTQLTAV